MKDKNTIIGWVLIALVFIGFMMYSNHNAKEQAELMKQQAQKDSI